MSNISFNKPYITQDEVNSIIDSLRNNKISGDGKYTKLCNEWFMKNLNRKFLLTPGSRLNSAIVVMSTIYDKLEPPGFY